MASNKAVDVFQGEDGQWYFNISARNGETVASSEGYTVEESAYKGALAVENALKGKQYDAVRQIASERTHQQLDLGYDVEHDMCREGELLKAAACYLSVSMNDPIALKISDEWPWDKEKWNPKSRKENLIRAAALIAAAIDVIDEQSDV